MRTRFLVAFAAFVFLISAAVRGQAAAAPAPAATAGDPLPSWNDTDAKKSILAFVEKVTTDGGSGFVPVEQRIATFDNDGTLWVEHPMYTQLAFALDRVAAMAPKHPEWEKTEPFASILKRDMAGVMKSGEKGLLEVVAATHAGMSVEEFNTIVADWIATAKHPRFKQPYTACIYQPMLELMTYLRGKQFQVYIVSGGGVEFMRAFAEKTYGVPPQQTIGSSGLVKFEMKDGLPVLIKEPKIQIIDDGPGKPESINLYIGRRPLMSFGNSDGDIQMLQWATMRPAGAGEGFGLLVHHTDAEREYKYDRDTHFGKLDKGLDEAAKLKWTVVDMKADWKTIFAFEK